MPFCPNLSNPVVKREFDILTKKHGEDLAYYLWDKYQGVVPAELVKDREKQIESYFKDRFGESSVFIKNSLDNVAGAEVFGYVQEGAAHIARFAPADTAYHEAFHVFFRTTLNEAQREQLYKDAVKRYGEPTAEDIQKAARGQERLDDMRSDIYDSENAYTGAELRLLALEERMAEEFRFYSMSEVAPKGLGKRIAKFFQDLWAYIKAVVGKPLTIRQAFRLLESNKIPAKFTRNITQFGDSTAFMIKEFATNPAMHAELTRIGASIIVDSYDAMLAEVNPSDRKAFTAASSRKAAALLGDRRTQGPSEVRDAFLRLSVSYADGGQLTYTDFVEYRRLYDAANESQNYDELVAFMADKNIYADPPHKDVRGVEISKMFIYDENNDDVSGSFSNNFAAVYDNWYDKKLPNGRVQPGFRSDITGILPEFGFSLKEKDETIEDQNAEVERIYSISRLEEDPGETLTQKQRILLSRIPIDDASKTLTGISTYVPAMEVYKAVLDSVADVENFSEMMNRLEAKGKTIPMLQTVYDKINSLEDHEQASLFYALNTAYHKFIRIEIQEEGKGKNTSISSRIYSPNTGAVIKSTELAWRKSSTVPGGLFKKRPEADGGGFLIDQKKRDLALELADRVGIDVKKTKFQSRNLNTEQQADLARLMMVLGLEIGANEAEAIDRVQAAFKNPKNLSKFFKAKLPGILKGISERDSIATSFFEDEGSTIKTIIRTFVAPFQTSKAQAFTNSLNKSVYAINKKARLNNEEKRIRNGRLLEFLGGTLHHDLGGRTSILHKLISSSRYTEDFEFQTVEAFGMQTQDDMFNFVPEEMTPEQLIATRLNAWYNGGKNLGYAALDTQGDRKRYTLMPIPKLDITDVAQDYGITAKSFTDLFRDELLLDLNRMKAALEDISAAIESGSYNTLIEGYHYRIKDGVLDFSLGGWNNFNLMNTSIEVDPTTGIPVDEAIKNLMAGVKIAIKKNDELVDETDIETFESLVKDVVEAVDQNIREVALDLGATVEKDGKIKISKKSEAYAFLKSNVDNAALGNPEEFITQYATYDYIGRIISRSLFRSGVNFTKDGANYVKRAQLITTPGSQGTLKGDLPDNPTYGLSRTFNAATVRDIMAALPEESLEEFRKALVPLVGEDAALNIVGSYRNIQSTDAQSFISPKHYYELMQYKGVVDETFEEVYANYLETGKWDPRVPLVAQKPSWDGQIKKQSGEFELTVPYSDKTSYVVLTRELVEGIPLLEDLLDRMEAVKAYEGLETIEVVQTESAQKLAIIPPHEVRVDEIGQFGEMAVQSMDSQFLRFPEEVPLKGGKAQLLLAHQAKVNMSTNIDPDGRFVYNDGLDFAEETTGAEMQTLFHEALAEKLRRSLGELHNEIGYDAVLNTKDAAEREAAIRAFIPKLRARLKDMSLDKNYNEAALDAIESLPLGFPGISSKFDQLLFSLYKNAYRQKVPGQQMVQFADFGGVRLEEDTDATLQPLKFLDVEGGRVVHAEVDIRADFLEAIGIDATGDISTINEELRRVMGYRIPQQGKSSLLIMKIRGVLPKSHDGVIRVPPGITTMMGSDFDIDKMFIMFPEIEGKGKTAQKVRVPYLELNADPAGITELTDAQINNIFFDTFEAVASNIKHVHETFTPLDGEDLQAARNSSPYATKDQNIFSTVDSVRSTVTNMLSHRLRGIWADAVLGRNVVMGSQVNKDLLVGQTLKFKDTEGTIKSDRLQLRAVFKDVTGAYRPTDYFMSLHLGAAVDSVNDPLQEAINDNTVTAKIATYLYARGLTPAQVSVYLNHPIVRPLTDLARKENSSLTAVIKNKYAKEVRMTKNKVYDLLDFEQMRQDIADAQEGKYKKSMQDVAQFIKTLLDVSKEANDLYNLLSAVTVFTIDKSGTLPQNLAMYDSVENYLTKSTEGSIYGGKELISAILEGDAYKYSRSVWEGIQTSLQVAGHAGFLANQPGYQQFRKFLMNLGKGNPYREDAQKAILNAVNHHLVTKPGSPLFEQGFLDKTLVESLLLSEDKEGSIIYELNRVKQILGKLGIYNALVESLEIAAYTFSNEKKMHYLEYNNRKQRDVGEENAIIAGWEELYFNTSGTMNEEDAAYAKQFAEHVLTNAIVTTGFAPGARSMMNILPPTILEDIGVSDHYNQQIENLQFGRTELASEFGEDFMLHYGGYRYGNETILRQYSPKALGLTSLALGTTNVETVKWAEEKGQIPEGFILVRGILGGLVKVTAQESYGDTMVTFELVSRRSVKGRLYEHNLRTEEGTVFDGSLIFEQRELKKLRTSKQNPSSKEVIKEQAKQGPSEEDLKTLKEPSEDGQVREAPEENPFTPGEVDDFRGAQDAEESGPSLYKSLIDFSLTESPRGVQNKIARLTSSFSAAGVEVKFVLASLPEGTKGMVEGNIVTIDPAQMGADTAYHEVGHILVDMLPEADVRQYIAQVEKSRPDIAGMVRVKYANEGLTEFEMGKEILVTAIGIEGAKIERKNPSKLQIIINRILRAIGKLFGITPDAAAVLAEKMFAGDIKSMVITKELNPRIRLQKTLEDQIDTIFVEGYKNLERQIRELKFKPETLRTKAEILKIKQLQATLANISENKASIEGFFTFSEYVHEQAEIMKIAFDELRRIKDNPVKKEEAMRLLNKIDDMQHTMSTFFNHKDRSRSLIDQLSDTVDSVIAKEKDPTKKLLLSEQVQRNLDRSIKELSRLHEEYIDLVAPLVADSYAAFFDSGMNEKIDEIIEGVRKTRDTSGIMGDVDYQTLKRNKAAIQKQAEEDGVDPKEAWKNAVLELKINKLQAKKLNRDNIISELKNAHTDKHPFSLWLDPMIYSSEANLQMFAMALNESNFNTNKKSIPLINEAAEEFKLYKEYAGDDTNKAKFYAPFITIVSPRMGGQRLPQLSLVQPYDIDAFDNNMYTFLDNLAKSTNRPEYDATNPESVKAYEKWIKSPQGKSYYTQKAGWSADNTVPVANAETKLRELRAERSKLIEQKLAADQMDQPAQAAILQEYINDISTTIRNSYSKKNNQFMGALAMPNEKYKSAQYEKIQATPELKRFYDFLVNTYKEKQVPYGKNNPQFMNRWEGFSYILPSVRQSNIEAVQRLGLKGVVTELKDTVVRTETDQELYGAALDGEGKAAKYLPRYYTNAVNEKDVTRDILSSILMYSHRSNQYVERSGLVGLVNAMSNLHQRREVIQKDDTGAKLMSREAMQFMKKYRDYAIDPTATVPGGASNTVNHLMQFIDTAFYGITKQKLENKILGMDPTKFVGTINSLAAFGSLSFNFLQIGNQTILDNLMIREEAIAGEFFDNADLRWAKGAFASNGAGIKDIGAFTPTSKLGKTMLYFDALVEATDSLGQDASDNKFLKSIQMGNLLALQGAVEYQTAAVRMLASMKALEGKFVDKNGEVIMNEKGNPANLWDLMIETKKGVELDPRVDKEKSKFDEARFMAKLRGLYKRTNQVKGSQDASTLSRTPWGSFVMLFKNYLIPGFRKRWGHGDIYHIDLELDTVNRGMYQSFAGFIKTVFRNEESARDIWETMSEVDKRNVKRTFTEIGVVGFTAILFFALESLLDDDDEDNYLAAFAAYQSRRLHTELTAFINPGEALRMFVAPMAAANRMEKYWDLMTHTVLKEVPYDGQLLLGMNPSESLTKEVIYQRDSYWGQKGDRKIWGKIGKVMPAIYGFSTLDAKTVEDKIRFFK